VASFYYYFSEERGISDRARGGEDVGGVCIDEPGNLDSDEVGGAARHAIVARVGAGGCKGDGGLTRWLREQRASASLPFQPDAEVSLRSVDKPGTGKLSSRV